MQLARFARTVGLFLILGSDGLVAGCGSGGEQGASGEGKAVGKVLAAERKELQQERKAAKRQGKGKNTKSLESATNLERAGKD